MQQINKKVGACMKIYNSEKIRNIAVLGHSGCGKTNLLEVGEIIRNAELVINGCSFPVHVANAFDTPVIGLYGSQPVWRGAPQRIYKAITSPVKCAGCDLLFNGPGWCEKPVCMKQITPVEVMKCVKQFYDEGKPLGMYKLVTGK